ncbi:MAG TPA: hypothetical protein VGD54_18680 [Steroidobacteraceae bacterium]
MALLLVAILATDSLSETSELAGAIAKATTTDDSHPFKQTKTLIDTLAFMLTSRVWSSKLLEMSIVRTHGMAVLRFRDGKKHHSVEFRISGHSPTAVLRIEASLSGVVFRAIAKDVSEMETL